MLVVHYAEVGIKGGNRVFFVGMLKRNLHRALDGCATRQIRSIAGRLLVDFGRALAPSECAAIVSRVRAVPGVAHFAICDVIADRDLAELQERVVDLARGRHGEHVRTFSIASHRSDKSFPLTSIELNRRLGTAVVAATGLDVDLEHPDLTLHVEILDTRSGPRSSWRRSWSGISRPTNRRHGSTSSPSPRSSGGS
jgi:thiamine biosynthesis protein ThiI